MGSPAWVARLIRSERITVVRDRKGNIIRGYERQSDGSSALRATIYVGTKYSYKQQVGRGKAWELKKLGRPSSSWDYADPSVRSLFQRVVLDCLTSFHN
jgi:hypothetical protein